jgi:hypothetical protein
MYVWFSTDIGGFCPYFFLDKKTYRSAPWCRLPNEMNWQVPLLDEMIHTNNYLDKQVEQREYNA